MVLTIDQSSYIEEPYSTWRKNEEAKAAPVADFKTTAAKPAVLNFRVFFVELKRNFAT